MPNGVSRVSITALLTNQPDTSRLVGIPDTELTAITRYRWLSASTSLLAKIDPFLISPGFVQLLTKRVIVGCAARE